MFEKFYSKIVTYFYLFDRFSLRVPRVLASFSDEFRAFIFFLVVISSSELTVSMKTLEAGRDSWW